MTAKAALVLTDRLVKDLPKKDRGAFRAFLKRLRSQRVVRESREAKLSRIQRA